MLIPVCILNATVFCQAQSDCQAPPELKYFYKFDVADLAINQMFEINSPDLGLIEIPQVHLDSVWNGLAAIYNASAIPERDSVFDIFCIHNLSAYSRVLWPAIYIKVDTSESWTGSWFNGEITTGYTELDNFLSNYNYRIYSSNPSYASVVIYSDSLINPYAVSDSLVFFSGIISADPMPTSFDANKIEYHINGENQFFTFTLAWGDCMSGCIYRLKWNFKVHYSNCSVEYTGPEANTFNNLPDPVNCNITSINNDAETNSNGIRIFPNPAGNSISIVGKEIQNIKIFDALGILLHSTGPDSEKTTVNIENFKPGIYFLKIDNNGKSINGKFIKQ